MKPKLDMGLAKNLHKKRKQTVEPVFGIIKTAMGVVRFQLRSISSVAAECKLVAVTCSCRQSANLQNARSRPRRHLYADQAA